MALPVTTLLLTPVFLGRHLVAPKPARCRRADEGGSWPIARWQTPVLRSSLLRRVERRLYSVFCFFIILLNSGDLVNANPPPHLIIRNDIGRLWRIPDHRQINERFKVYGVRFTEYWIASFSDLKPYTLNHIPCPYMMP